MMSISKGRDEKYNLYHNVSQLGFHDGLSTYGVKNSDTTDQDEQPDVTKITYHLIETSLYKSPKHNPTTTVRRSLVAHPYSQTLLLQS